LDEGVGFITGGCAVGLIHCDGGTVLSGLEAKGCCFGCGGGCAEDEGGGAARLVAIELGGSSTVTRRLFPKIAISSAQSIVSGIAALANSFPSSS